MSWCQTPAQRAAALVGHNEATLQFSTLQDLYKSAFQDRFGPGHIVRNREACKRNIDEEIAEFRDSMRRGFREVHGWSDKDIAEAESRVRMLNPKGKMGKEFIAYLRRVQRKYHFDLVVINPLQGVAGIDLSQNKELTEFCRGNGLDSIIKDEETKCGLLVIHHTNKPPSDADKRNFGKGAFAQYIGAGGQEINAWMRGMLLLMPTIEPGVYELSAVKRGNRLGWTNPPGKNYLFPTKLIRQSPKEDLREILWGQGPVGVCS